MSISQRSDLEPASTEKFVEPHRDAVVTLHEVVVPLLRGEQANTLLAVREWCDLFVDRVWLRTRNQVKSEATTSNNEKDT